jgi:hypothetical protein
MRSARVLIRTGFSDKSLYFIIQAYRHGIGTIGIVYPTNGANAKTKKRWSDAALSEADPQGFAAWLKPPRGDGIKDFYAAMARTHILFGPTFYYCYDLLIDANGALLPEARVVATAVGKQ